MQQKILATIGLWSAALGLGSTLSIVWAYPPAPHHVIEGVVRDSYGTPLGTPSARITLETSTGQSISAPLIPTMRGGLNYRLTIPMDAGVTPERYRPTALQPLVPFRIKVTIGRTTWLPIEMQGSLVALGQPAQRTRLDLTLGVDSDGDGLPDAWEYALLQQLGGNGTLQDIRPEDDLDGDGLSNLQEYLAGTYAYDRSQSLLLELADVGTNSARLRFTAVTGRTYQVLTGSDLRGWNPVPFRVLGTADGPVTEYKAADVRLIEVEVQVPESGSETSARFFRLKVF